MDLSPHRVPDKGTTVRLQEGGHFLAGLHSDTVGNEKHCERRLEINEQDT